MVMQGGYVSDEDMEAELFGEPHRGTLSYLRERVERYAPRITELFNGFFEDSRQMYERYNGTNALRRIRARLRRSTEVLRGDVVRPLHSLSEIQKAKPTMQRYIMANLVSRLLENQQLIDGYSDTYRNSNKGVSGFEDEDFMRVIDGVVFTDYNSLPNNRKTSKADEEDAWVSYVNLFDSDERDLDIVEQSDILSTWEVLEMFYSANAKDPTSILNEDM